MTRTISATIGLAALSVLTMVAPTAGESQGKHPNLSGTWTMNAAKSKFEVGGPTAIKITFEHKDPSLAEALTLTGAGGDRTANLTYTTDGKESTQPVLGAPAQTSARWEGKTLTIEWKAGPGRQFSRAFTPNDDGKAITMIVKQSTADGNTTTDTILLEKQPAK